MFPEAKNSQIAREQIDSLNESLSKENPASQEAQQVRLEGSYLDDQRTKLNISLSPMANIVMIDFVSENAAKKARIRANSDSKSIRQSIMEAQNDFTQSFQSNSKQTILAITNTMVGSVCLVVPQVFLQYGIISCLLVMIVLGLIQYKTCSLLITHQRLDEVETEQTIKRLLGKKMAIAFRLTSGSLLFIVGIVYFLLINSTLYPILKFILMKNGIDNFSKQSQAFQFDQFSIQCQALIIFIPVSIPFFFKEITTLIKMAEYGVVAIFSYGIFVIYIFSRNLIDGTYFTWNLSQPAGQFALAFMIHNGIGQLIKTNKVKTNNKRDLGVAYFLAGLVYGSIGVFGAFGLLGRSANNPSTILDFFDSGDISVLIIEALFLVHLLTAFPIFNFISRHQVLNAFYPDSSHPAWLTNFYSVIYILTCLMAQLANFNPGVVIAFDGAVCGFFLIYIVPISMHMTCYYSNQRGSSKVSNSSVTSSDKYRCIEHENKNQTTKITRMIIYGSFICVGLLNMAIQFNELFNG